MIANQLLHQLNLAKVTAPEPPVTTGTSAYHVKATTLESAATKTRADLPGNDSPASSRSLNVECDNISRQLHSYCRPQSLPTSLTFEESQHLHKFTPDDKLQAASEKLHSHLMPESQSSIIPPLPSCLKNFISKYQLSTHSQTPINIPVLNLELVSHPDCHFVDALLNNLTNGCNIGCTRPQFNHSSQNLHSAYQHPAILDATIAEECKLGRFLGPLDKPPLPSFRSSGLGLVPKHDGGWRTICHLSAPHGFSINSHIYPESFSLTYCSVDDAFAIVNSLGTGALMSKIDLKNAFRLIPVHPIDWNLLGMQWSGKFYIDTFLPFGLRSAPFLFNQLSIAIHWILQHKYSVYHLLHILMIFSLLVLLPLKNVQATSPRCSHYAVK